MAKEQQEMLSSGCAACQMREVCQSPEARDIPRKQSWKAVVMAYVVPFVVLIGVVIGLGGTLDNEPLVGTIALCSVGVYYIVLHIFRQPIEKDFQCKNNIKK